MKSDNLTYADLPFAGNGTTFLPGNWSDFKIPYDTSLTKLIPAICMYGLPIILLLGSIGNILIIVVMARRRIRAAPKCQSRSTNVNGALGSSRMGIVGASRNARKSRSTFEFYLIVLACADLLVLYVHIPPTWIDMTLLPPDTRVEMLSNVMCKSSKFLKYFSKQFSVSVVCLLSLDRMISLLFPFTVKRTYRRRVAIAICVLLVATVNSHIFWTNALVTKTVLGFTYSDCTFSDKRYSYFVFRGMRWMDFTMYTFVPFTIILASNSAIIIKMLRRRRQQSTTKALRFTTEQSFWAHASPVTDRRKPVDVRANVAERLVWAHCRDVTNNTVMILAAICVVFLCTTLPLTGVRLYRVHLYRQQIQLLNQQFGTVVFLEFCALYFALCNHALNFIAYGVVGAKFRRDLQNLCCQSKQSGRALMELRSPRGQATSDALRRPAPSPSMMYGRVRSNTWQGGSSGFVPGLTPVRSPTSGNSTFELAEVKDSAMRTSRTEENIPLQPTYSRTISHPPTIVVDQG